VEGAHGDGAKISSQELFFVITERERELLKRMQNVPSTFYSLNRKITFVVISDKGVVALFAAGMELHSCCRACLFILAVEMHIF
jgi:hypothetical protein